MNIKKIDSTMIANIFILTSIIFSEQKTAAKANNLIEVGDKKDALKKEVANAASEKKIKNLKEKKINKLKEEKLLEEEELFNDIMKKPLLKAEKVTGATLNKSESKSHDLLKAENKNSDLLKTLSGSSHTPNISSLMTKKFSYEELESQLKELHNNFLNVMDMFNSLKDAHAKENKSKAAELKAKK